MGFRGWGSRSRLEMELWLKEEVLGECFFFFWGGAGFGFGIDIGFNFQWVDLDFTSCCDIHG